MSQPYDHLNAYFEASGGLPDCLHYHAGRGREEPVPILCGPCMVRYAVWSWRQGLLSRPDFAHICVVQGIGCLVDHELLSGHEADEIMRELYGRDS
jgi:hypothetical protein